MTTVMPTPELLKDLEAVQAAFAKGDLATITDLMVRRAAEAAVDRDKVDELEDRLWMLVERADG